MALIEIGLKKLKAPCHTCIVQAGCSDRVGCMIYLNFIKECNEREIDLHQRYLLVGRCWTYVAIGLLLYGFLSITIGLIK